jgi:DMSO/TMAO reductase YedYZ molybdopterin-dependent catalytic subunit
MSMTHRTGPKPDLPHRRQWLRWAAAAGLGALGCARHLPEPAAGGADDQLLRFPEKVPLRALNDRPPNLETPWSYYRTDLTPNAAFFVRWHLDDIPTAVDLRTWRLRVGGHVGGPLELSMDDLRRMPATSVVAVNQCSGNSRGLFEPHVPGGQWGNGAMGNARWAGVPLCDLLNRAGLKGGAADVTFAGLDRASFRSVPDFVKSLAVERALDPKNEILVAYEMNGEPLPLLNGFPARLVVPGWYGTYWVKALSDISVRTQPFEGYWMKPGYRIPKTPGAVEDPNHLTPPDQMVPISRLNVRSFFVSPAPESRLTRGQAHRLEGIAFDGGDGIRRAEVWADGGPWQEAELGDDLGRFSFRRWRFSWRPTTVGRHRLLVRAVSGSGEEQPATAGWNRSGYMRNVIEELSLEVV